MALIKASLQAELISIYEKGPMGNPFPAATGIKTGRAYLNYCAAGQNQAGMPMTAMPGAATLGGDLAEIYSTVSPANLGSLTATKMATAFDICLSTFLSTFQTSMVTGPFAGLLQTNLDIAFSKPALSATEFAGNLAMALHLATTAPAIQCSGVVPGPAPYVFSGPIV